MSRITWRKEPSLGGLSSVGQGPRGYIAKIDGFDVATVAWSRGDSWGWYSSYGGKLRNTWEDGLSFPDVLAARADATLYLMRKRAEVRPEPPCK